ncbi:ABC transporter ATP-binding protein (plasmid) [Haladaptatus sp. SPP-AMP-3]|uniref:ABC transporter ATP-binding protein n=1 Tax=Haladaptatus sp. SPP-AMP-3 TaxID=3121295 RepID=UPI003C2F752A
MLRLNDVVAGYGRHRILDGLSMVADAGCTALLGPNGGGKTTLFRVGAGVLEPKRGSVSIDGGNPFDNPEIKRDVGYVPHTPSLPPNLPVRETLAFWGRVLELDADDTRERIDSLADSLEFRDLLATNGSALSRGQAQRVALARGLLSDPSLVFLDEPTTGLDPSVTSKLLDLLRMLAESDTTLVYSTHNLHEAEALADEIVLLNEGKIVSSGSTDEIVNRQGTRKITVTLATDNGGSLLRDLGFQPVRHGRSLRFEIDVDTTVVDVIERLGERGAEVVDVETERDPLQSFFETVNREGTDA